MGHRAEAHHAQALRGVQPASGRSLLSGDALFRSRDYELEHTKSWTYIWPPNVFFFFFAFVTVPTRSSSLELSDTRVCEPQIPVRLGATAQFCKGVVRRPDHALQPPLHVGSEEWRERWGTPTMALHI